MERKRVRFTSGVKVSANITRLHGTGSMRKIRCPHCKGLANPTTVAGRSMIRCSTCGAVFKSQRIG
jgi:ribosomal protein S27E